MKSTPIEPLADELDFIPQLLRSLSIKSTKGGQFPKPSRQNTSQTFNSLAKRVKDTLSGKKGLTTRNGSGTLGVQPQVGPESDQEREEEVARHMERLKTFSFSESQRLTSFATTLQEIKLAMTLNFTVLRGLREYYQGLRSSWVPHELELEYARGGALRDFVRRIKSLEGHLEAECIRAETLIRLIEEGKRQVSTPVPSFAVFNRLG